MRPGPGGSFALPAGSPTSGAHPINASRNCASFGADRRIRERGAPHLTVMATPLSSGPRRGTPRSVELRCEAFVFFPSVDFYSRPREMRSGELPRLRPPRVESWRARRGGLEGAGKSGMAWPDFDDHQLLITITCAFAASTRGPGRFNIHAPHRLTPRGRSSACFSHPSRSQPLRRASTPYITLQHATRNKHR